MLDFNVKRVYQTVQLWWTLWIVANSSSTYLFILWVVQTQLIKKKALPVGQINHESPEW